VQQGPRYAIYFVPAAQSALYRYGSSVLGYDCYTGQAVDFPRAAAGGAVNWNELGQEPRRYGFHATLKAPFYLLPSHGEAQLIKAMQDFARLGHAALSFEPEVRLLNGFFAVMPAKTVPAVDALAASCTTIFDAFRAPITPQDRARLMALQLTESQVRNLDRWGFPYVLADFRFHMTLTGKVPAARRRTILADLQKGLRRTRIGGPIALDRLALLKQETRDAAFRVIGEVALNGDR
jgi:hypothetical protein